MNRKSFLQQSSTVLAGTLASPSLFSQQNKKQRIAMVGTGVRGIGMWGNPVIKEFADQVEFVGLCDINPGRLETARNAMQLSCPSFTDFDEMMQQTKPDRLMVMTVDGTHHEFIVKGMEYGADIITEKPMTIDEKNVRRL